MSLALVIERTGPNASSHHKNGALVKSSHNSGLISTKVGV